MKKTRVLIVDDQKISRQFFEMSIKNSDAYILVKAIDSASLVDIYLAKYEVDLIIMDIVMADGFSGLDACEYVKNNYPEIKLVVVTSMPETRFMERAKEIGVDSFWYKEVSREPLLDVLKRTIDGERVYPEDVPDVMIGRIGSSEFSVSELKVLRELATGAGNAEIAEKLELTVNTVKTHILHMLAKTGFANRTELAIEARIKGIVVP